MDGIEGFDVLFTALPALLASPAAPYVGGYLGAVVLFKGLGKAAPNHPVGKFSNEVGNLLGWPLKQVGKLKNAVVKKATKTEEKK